MRWSKPCLNERGMVTGVVLAVVLLVLGIGGAMLQLSASEGASADGYIDGMAAHYLAEAGVKKAVSQLPQDPLWPGESAKLGEGMYQVTVNPLSGKISSTGKVHTAARQLTVSYTISEDDKTGNKIIQYTWDNN
ncbi:hypothetical protein [Propionispora vibrioides]|uniref:Uncharacterized protein n=1 Tax=Propionispora vibrioides TaxID=112903 RepID=A0A1H8NZ57_9FIRM|nr:hypothetical protein [Propionispora vibrioides]SEO34946.1 hypothetical protein SAMN04490178_101283 [Propionispora vibrioides]